MYSPAAANQEANHLGRKKGKKNRWARAPCFEKALSYMYSVHHSVCTCKRFQGSPLSDALLSRKKNERNHGLFYWRYNHDTHKLFFCL